MWFVDEEGMVEEMGPVVVMMGVADFETTTEEVFI